MAPVPTESTKVALRRRLDSHARTRWPQLADLDVRHSGAYAYLTARLPDGDRLPLCRLRYTGSATSWGFAVHQAGHDHYEDSDRYAGTPEFALDTACGRHLADPDTRLCSPPPRAGRSSAYEIVLVAYHSGPLVRLLLAQLPPELPVVIVDNAHGVDGLAEVPGSRPATRYLDGPGAGFASGANLGARSSEHDVVIFVNPDSSPSGGQLDALAADIAGDDGLAAVSATTVLPDGQVEIGVGGWEPSVRRALVHAIGAHKVFPTAGLWARPVPGRPIELDWLSGACMAVRRRTFLDLGGFDEQFFVYNEDVAFGRQVREAGWGQRLRTDLLVAHLGGGSGAGRETMLQLRGASFVRYVRRHNRRPAVLGIRLALTAGYGARRLLCRLTGCPDRAREHAAYLKGLWLGPPT